MHIVFVVGSYYPNYSAVGKCAGNVADELSKTHKITVVCQKSFCEQENTDNYNDQSIIRVLTKDKLIRDKLNKKIKASRGIKNKLFNFLLKSYQVFRVVSIILSKYTINKDLVKSYAAALKNIEDPIDAIAAVCMPFEGVLAAAEYKNTFNSKVKIIPYLFDQFADSDTLHRIELNKKLKRKNHIALEKRIFKAADFVLAMHSLREHFQRDLSEIENIKFIEHPLIIDSAPRVNTNNIGIKISYIGGLYKNYVTPDYLLKLFSTVNIDKAVLHFYIIGNCSEIVDSYCSNMPEKIINHGSVDKQTASCEIANSNILISIAELKGIQMSSKIFEYMSYGKPIVHFYSSDNDVNLKILNKYPLALCLKQDNKLMDENLKKFNRFCIENYRTSIEFSQVEALFIDASPKYTAELIEQITSNTKVGIL